MPTEPILAETIAGMHRIPGDDLDHIAVDPAVVGLFFAGVKLDAGTAGVCATPLRSIPQAVCCPSSAMGDAVSRQAARYAVALQVLDAALTAEAPVLGLRINPSR